MKDLVSRAVQSSGALAEKLLSRRSFQGIAKNLWFLLLMVPWRSSAQSQCCHQVNVSCSTAGYSNCSGTSGLTIGDDFRQPYCFFAYTSACIWCVVGCSCCTHVQMTCIVQCCDFLFEWEKNMCCSDPDCCMGCPSA